jgi:diguanylate cyclase (GGDEF)-like protein
MDPTTAVVLMTLNLAVTGALVALVARHNLGQRPLLQCAASTGLFAVAFGVRLSLGLGAASPWALLPDTAMVFAAALFLRGQRQFMHRPVWPLSGVLGAAVAFAAVHAVATTLGGQQLRHVLLNGALGTLYLAMALAAWRGLRELPAFERPSQRLMMGTALVLGSATLLRAGDALLRGVDTLFAGPTAQAYYALSSICILLMGPSVLWWMFTRLTDDLQRLATHDPLTGALNRNGLAQAMRRHFALRQVRPVVWLMLDLDHFKRVNDTLGHRSGDRLLQAVAQTLLQHVRAEDLVARLGGEEFLVGVVGPAPGLAETLAERLRAAVAALPFSGPDGRPWPCSVSIGVSPPFEQANEWENALRIADDALYAAKAAGRDRVVVGAAESLAG